MPPLGERKSIAKTLRKYRLEIARVILRNESYRSLLQSDIQSSHEFAELCDDYALQMFIWWLSTKYGCSAYACAIGSTEQAFDRWQTFILACEREYPFANCLQSALSKSLAGIAIELLETSLEPSLYLLGSLYEQIVEEPLTFDRTGKLYMQKERNRQLSGQFYTPPWIVKYCFDQAFNKDLSNFISTFKAVRKYAPAQVGDQVKDFAILDPACGTGNFLLGAVDWLAANGLTAEQLLSAVEHSFYGLEVDGRAASLCRIGLLLSLAREFEHIRQIHGDLFASQRCNDLLNALKRNVRVGDSVMSASLEQANPFNRKFDLVATNPPYISYGSRNQPAQSVSAARYLRSSYPEAAEYKIRLHSLFQDIAIRFASDDGRVVLFLPDAFLTGSYYQKLRRMLLKTVEIESLTELPEGVIGDATVGRWCVASYRVNRLLARSAYEVELNSFSAERLRQAVDESAPPCPIAFRRYSLPIEVLVSPEKSRFRLLLNDADRDIWLMMDKLDRLGSVLTGHTGIRALAGQNSIKSDRDRGQTWRMGITSGSSVNRHIVSWAGDWLNVEPSLLYGGGYDPQVIERPKLMVRQTADRIIAGCDEQGLYHLNNVHSLCPSKRAARDFQVDLTFYDGLINSNFWLYLYQSKSREGGRALAQIDIEMLEAMPIPALRTEFCQLVSVLVSAARAIQRKPVRKVNDSPGESLLSLLERSIDRLVYDLYGLCEAHVSWIEATCMTALTLNGDLPDIDKVKALVGSLQGSATVSPAAQAGGKN